jgi:subtilisin family serine protease
VVVAGPPPRRERDLPRRPVVAVLDTGISAHPWFGVEPNRTPDGSGFVAVDQQIQQQVADNHGAPGWLLPLGTFWERPVGMDLLTGPDTLLGELDSHWGHGTFIAGLVRQAEPEAQVLAIRVMYSDGVAYESDVLCALEALENRVRRAQAEGRPDLMVDIVVLSLGYYPEDLTVDPPVAAHIDRLASLGVLVCASAGNGSTSRRFYPAALADRPSCAQAMVSVGSLNPNRSKALFSNDGSWVHRWAPGAAVVSTFPISAGAIGPDHAMVADAPSGQPQRREAMDDDDFSSGFALWNGTSFAAPLVAARLATLMIDGGPQALAAVTVQATQTRATNAVHALPDYVWPR